MKISTEELTQRGINAFKCALGCLRPSDYDPKRAELCFAAARTWANRAEYSIGFDCQLAEADFAEADRVMFECRRLVEADLKLSPEAETRRFAAEAKADRRLPCGCRVVDQLLCTHGYSQLA